MARVCGKNYKEVNINYSMAESDTGMLLFGLAVLLGMGFLIWKLSTPTEGAKMGGLKITEFVRDAEGRVIQVIEK